MSDRMNIVFLGSNHNLISIECLRGILTGGQYSVLVGIVFRSLHFS